MLGMGTHKVTAVAHANVALVKYWGKRVGGGNLPAVGSLSVGLEALQTTTSLSVASADRVMFNGQAAGAEKAARIISYLDLWRCRFGFRQRLAVETANNFPTGAGLASSASGFAALALALDRLLGAGLAPAALSCLARQGSGSAARSLFGGFVELPAAMDAGDDPAAKQLLAAEGWPLHVLVAITQTGEKAIGSTEAMARAAASSPYYEAWVQSHGEDLAGARQALQARDFVALAEIAERNCLKMHATVMSASPPLIYWTGATLAVVQRVRGLRDRGLNVFFTIDAGPQVKVICDGDALPQAQVELAAIDGVRQVIYSAIGGAPSVSALGE